MEYKNRQNILSVIAWFKEHGYTDNFICGLLGNIQTETANSFDPKQVQLSALKAYGITNEDYVLRVDNGSWSVIKNDTVRDFTTDGIGFGLAQWTSAGRKSRFLAYCKERGKSIGDLLTQCAFIDVEIHSTGYATCRKAIKDNWSVEECARIICTEYERPASMQTAEKENAIKKRVDYALAIYDEFYKEKEEEKPMATKKITICLDAGHYGKVNQSPVFKSYYESVAMWKFTQWEAEELTKLGFEVILTRSDMNKDLSLDKRGRASKGGDVFISNHSNACGTESVDRVSVIIAVNHGSNLNNDDKALATMIADNCTRVMGLNQKPNIYTKDAGYDRNGNGKRGDDEYYGVLNGAQAVNTPIRMIVEHSFHTNTKSAKWLYNDANLKALAISEAHVIATYFGCDKVVVEDNVVAPVVSTFEYIVQSGDTLSKIAKKYGTTVDEIVALNPKYAGQKYIYAGDVWLIPNPNNKPTRITSYTVISGDGLSKIAKKLKDLGTEVTWTDIAKANNIKFPYVIHAGQKLIIP